uniref:SHSP domain-containing protein n=1 Tax=Romanomermis culicivorax TaxID=13658 RepID=A0A915K7A9_ROMCU
MSLWNPFYRTDNWLDAGLDDFGLFGQQFFDRNWPNTRRRSPIVQQTMAPPTLQQGGDEVRNEEDMFTVNIDVSHFAPEEIKVKIIENNLIVEAKHEERMDQHGFVARTFTRRYALPKDVDQNALKSNLTSTGVLSIEAPKLVSEVKAKGRTIPIQFGQQPSAITDQRKTP